MRRKRQEHEDSPFRFLNETQLTASVVLEATPKRAFSQASLVVVVNPTQTVHTFRAEHREYAPLAECGRECDCESTTRELSTVPPIVPSQLALDRCFQGYGTSMGHLPFYLPLFQSLTAV
jgi:hypothetical protein